MATEYDDGFQLDLRDYQPPRRRRGGYYRIADPWLTRSSPLDHWYLATSECSLLAVGGDDPEACKRSRWEWHLQRCTSCARAEAGVNAS